MQGSVAVTSRDLLRMSRKQLDDLFRRSAAGSIPSGDTLGTALALPGTPVARVMATLVRLLGWQGKVFDARQGMLLNKVTPFGLRGFKARVYKAPSRFDGGEAIVLDYSRANFLTRRITDEIREVAPGTYLGQVYWGRTWLVHFALDVPVARG